MAAPVAAEQLPRTGIDSWILAVLAAMFLGTGILTLRIPSMED